MAAALRLQSEALVRLVRFVVILREPVSRAVSSFWFKDGHTVEQAMAIFERQMRERAQIDRCVRGAREWYRGHLRPTPPSSCSALTASPRGILSGCTPPAH